MYSRCSDFFVRSKKELGQANATGIFLDEESNDCELISNSEVVVLHRYDENDPRLYKNRCFFYVQRYLSGAILGGAGMITVVSDTISFPKYLGFLDQLRKECSKQDKNIQNEVFSQPVLVEITEEDKLKEWLSHYKEGEVDGFIFRNCAVLQKFRVFNKDVFTIFMGDSKEVHEFFYNGYECDSFIIQNISEGYSVGNIIENRASKIAINHNRALFKSASDETTLRIGVVALQGAYLLEKALLENIKVDYDVEIVLVHSKSEMEYLDGLVLGGGWHEPQYHLYSRDDLGIFDGIREFLAKGKHVFFSCAGAILARNPGKIAEGCHQQSGNFMDFGVINNCVNGYCSYQLLSSPNKWTELNGLFVGAPKFVDLGETVGEVGKVDKDTCIAVLEQKSSGSICMSSSVHSEAAAEYWLDKIFIHEIMEICKKISHDSDGMEKELHVSELKINEIKKDWMKDIKKLGICTKSWKLCC